MRAVPNASILAIRAIWQGNVMSFEPVTQDRRLYYRMLRNGAGTGSLTSEDGALSTIAYWRDKDWLIAE